MKNKVIIGVSLVLGIVLVTIIGLISFYLINLKAPNTNIEKEFIVGSGTPTVLILKELKEENLIKNYDVAKIYIYLNKKTNIQAGKYLISSNMSLKEIIDKLTSGDVIKDTISITFKEGKRLTEYVDQISNAFNMDSKEILKKLSDKTYSKRLIDKYYFITDEILNDEIYYPLEGYLYPDTYEFEKDSTIEDIITKMINELKNKIDPYKENIESSKYSFHEILTLASIVEAEAATEEDRFEVAGVFINRLNNGWSLGSDVTTYYGAKITYKDNVGPYLNDCNPYNTRGCVTKLPVGPILSPSIVSIKASINPNETENFFFVADINKKVYFSKTSAEQGKVINDLKAKGLWLAS